jgi:hypothetical protein
MCTQISRVQSADLISTRKNDLEQDWKTNNFPILGYQKIEEEALHALLDKAINIKPIRDIVLSYIGDVFYVLTQIGDMRYRLGLPGGYVQIEPYKAGDRLFIPRKILYELMLAEIPYSFNMQYSVALACPENFEYNDFRSLSQEDCKMLYSGRSTTTQACYDMDQDMFRIRRLPNEPQIVISNNVLIKNCLNGLSRVCSMQQLHSLQDALSLDVNREVSQLKPFNDDVYIPVKLKCWRCYKPLNMKTPCQHTPFLELCLNYCIPKHIRLLNNKERRKLVCSSLLNLMG